MYGNRNEHLKISVKVTREQYEKHKADMRPFIQYDFQLNQGDHVVLTYDFFANYGNDLVPRFEALIRILNDHEIEATATLEVLRGMQCLFAELILAIERRKPSSPSEMAVTGSPPDTDGPSTEKTPSASGHWLTQKSS